MTIRQETAARVTAWLEAHQQEQLEFLETLACMESPSSQKSAQHRLLEWLAAAFRELGFQTVRVPGKETGGFLYARPSRSQKGKPLQLMLGHCDTVWPEGTLDQMPVSRQETILSGPGVYDMKAGIAQVIFALRCLRELELTTPVTPLVLFNSDEEIGSRESTRTIARLARLADRAWVLEPPLGPEGQLKTRRKGLARFTLTTHGKAAHAGLDPQKGVNAIVEMAHLVQRLYDLNDFEGGTTVNVGLIEGGIAPNTVAPMSRVVVDVRAPNAEAAEHVEWVIRNLEARSPGIRLEIEGGFGRPPMEFTPRNRRLWQAAKGVGHTLGIRLEQAAAGGGSDANTASQYTATLDGLGTPGDGAHAVHEHIRIPALRERTALLALLLLLEPFNP
ncbi:M20 family metallopeptidase [Robiginitalea sp. M366]|uniref:M20 family metallopeptidase n=1 Tax=Robiginitalea aestuariiviva TaxID=3036903 RepID=UPI00240D9755|nr:M20 family metallopeptidase [Robiginitalea aestuariiviva]MDG1572034.1 M20 family metallopeptidase [Robiginitalea aestuariiviva]